MPEVTAREGGNAQQRVQLGLFSLPIPSRAPLVLWRKETVAITFSFTRSRASIL